MASTMKAMPTRRWRAGGNRWEHDVLHVSFDHVGMMPGDQYNLYIDPESHRVQC